MKRLLLVIFFIPTYDVCANYNEVREQDNYIQNIKTFNVNKKTYFHQAPDENSKLNKLFLIQGDIFSGYLQFNGFEFGRYIRKDDSIAIGWLKQSDLTEENNLEKKVDKITESDFTIYSPFDVIVLNSPFEKSNKSLASCSGNNQAEAGLWSNVISNENKNYKYFDYHCDGFSVRVSNINYDVLNDDFDTYRITTILLNDSKYITGRGIYVGMNINNIKNAYGNTLESGNNSISYSLDTYILRFILEKDIIKSIEVNEQIK